MKKIYLSLLLITCLMFSLQAQQQRNCGTMDYLASQLAADPGLAGRMEAVERDVTNWMSANESQRVQVVITIPVVFHIVYNTSVQNISDTRIMAQLDVLNKDFARLNADASNTPAAFQGLAVNTNIQFCLAQRDPSGNATTGIVRRQTSTSSFSSNNNIKFTSSGGDNAWPAGSYLNIWVGNLSGGLLGYAQFPGGSASTDGVVVLYSSVGGPSAPGTATPYHLGRTATHEVGHWINLRHIWGDSNCGNDQVSDTPTQQTSNFGCPSFPHVTCSNGPNGDMFMNYMDYTDDACMNMFSAGQASRMTASLNSTRSSLLTSLGCVPPSGGGSCGTSSGLNATSVTTSGATLNWSAVSGATSYNVQYKTSAGSIWTTTTSTTTSKAISGLSSGTAYVFQVQAVCGSTTGTYSGTGSFTTLSTTCSDIYEPNGSSSNAKVIAVNTDINATISSNGDVDWFRFTTTSPNTNIQLTLTNLPFDYDVRLYNSSLTNIATSQNGGTTSETINRNSSSATTYYVRVYGYNGAFSSTLCYKLRINTSSTPFRLEENMSNASKDELVNNIVPIPNPSSGQTTFEFLSEIPGDANYMIADVTGRIVYKGVYSVTEGINRMDLDLYQLENGIYFMLMEQQGDKRNSRFMIQH